MAFSKQTVLDKIEISENGTMQIRRALYILEDGVRVTDARYTRTAYVPGSDISNEPPLIRNIAALVWTPAVIAAYLAAQQAAGG